MHLYGDVSLVELESIAAQLGVVVESEAWEPEAIYRKILLRPTNGHFAMEGRYMVCEHGYEAFLAMLFEQKPNLHIATSVMIYDGLDEWMDEGKRDTARQNILHKFGTPSCSCGS